MSARSQKVVAIVLAGSFLAGGFVMVRSLNTMRRDFQLARLELPDQARADLLTNVLLSVGRALAVDYLWIGLQNMQQEGRYFDANQRAEWICRLQPHFPAVWIFQAWNMSYNISVAMNSGEDRWRWVMNGVKLLRDRGIPLNPRSIKMYHQLAWIFFHKIGAQTDDQHWYYKTQLARSIEPIIGWPEEKYDIMAEAPDTWDELCRLANMTEFLAAISGFDLDPREKFLDILTNRDNYGDKVLAVVDDPKYKTCRRMLEGFLRARWLYRVWKLDSKVIAEIRSDDPNEKYGPLDFRTAQAHAIYWAYMAVKAVGEDTSFDALSNDRLIYGSLQDLVRRGRLFFSEVDPPLPLFTPDIRFIPVVDRTYLAMGRKYAKAEGLEWDGTATQKFKAGHVNFLIKAISFYYQYGQMDLARAYWNELTTLYPNKVYDVGMNRFIRSFILEDIETLGLADANATINLMLQAAYRRYAQGDDYAAMGIERVAKMVHQAYMKGHKYKGPTHRVSLRPWNEIVAHARTTALRTLPPQLAERFRRRLGIETTDHAQETR